MAIAWAEKSEEDLFAALESIWFYGQNERAEICDEVERRRLLADEPHSFVVEQLRRYDGSSSAAAPLYGHVDLTLAARWGSAAVLAPSALAALSVLLLLLGLLELSLSGVAWGRVLDPGALAEGAFDATLGVVLLACSVLMRRRPRVVAIAALAVLALPTLLWLAWVVLLVMNGRLEPFRAVILSFLAVVCVVACVATLRLEALRRRRGPAAGGVRARAQLRANWKDHRAIATLIASWGVFAAGVAVWLLAGWLSKALREGGGVPALSDAMLALGLNLLGLALAFLAAPSLARLARRFASMSAQQLRRLDARRPLLLLRPFADDAVGMTKLDERLIPALFPPLRVLVRETALEEVLVTSASAYGPVVALSDPASRLPPVGAAREVTLGDGWRERVRDLIAESRAIIAVVGETPGLKSELLEIRAERALGKLALILPPLSARVLLRRIEVLFSCIPELRTVPVPDLIEAGVAIHFGDDGRPTLMTARRRAAAYAEAVDWVLCSTRADTDTR